MTDSQECYHHPRLWDLAFQDETLPEADFVEAVANRYLSGSKQRILECACGGGRQTVELARRGYDVTAFDLNPLAVDYTQRRLNRLRLSASVSVDDLVRFEYPRQFDIAHCFVNSFRHLQTETQAIQHLRCVARSLRPEGIYLLGFHLLPPDAEEFDCERWTVLHRGLRITTTVRVLEFSRRKRLEKIRFSLRARSESQDVKLRSDHLLRIYRADQFRSLLRQVPELELEGVYDFCYDVDAPRKLDDELGDAVFVLRNRTPRKSRP